MNTTRSLFGLACRAAAFSFLAAGSALLVQAQQPTTAGSALNLTPKTPLFVASGAAPASLTATSASSSSSLDAVASDSSSSSSLNLSSSALDPSQPPPRRSYGRPNYSDSHDNADGSSKYFFLAGAGLTLPVGDTHFYETPSYAFQVGGGRNFNKSVGVGLQFDYDHFGLQAATIQNQAYLYNTLLQCTSEEASAGECGVTGLDGNNHVWSFTLNPTYTLASEGSTGAYLVVGAGFYHKVTDFTAPTTEGECSIYFGCEEFTVAANFDQYVSNAIGVNGGLGLTYKFSKFSNERFYVEARYVLLLNSQRTGITAQSSTTAIDNYTGSDFYPANSNKTTYIPIKFGIRF